MAVGCCARACERRTFLAALAAADRLFCGFEFIAFCMLLMWF